MKAISISLIASRAKPVGRGGSIEAGQTSVQINKFASDTTATHIEETAHEISDKFRTKFWEKRRDAVKKFWIDGGGPATKTLWPDDEDANLNRILGKELLSRLNALGQTKYGHARNLFANPSSQLAQEIREFLIGKKLISI